jgi:hypothetical protein
MQHNHISFQAESRNNFPDISIAFFHGIQINKKRLP